MKYIITLRPFMINKNVYIQITGINAIHLIVIHRKIQQVNRVNNYMVKGRNVIMYLHS
jgi:hypothetical protein